MHLLNVVFDHFNLKDEALYPVFSAVVEVIFNAVKANIKFTLFKEELKAHIRRTAAEPEVTEVLNVILREEPLLDFMERYIVKDKIKSHTFEILMLDEALRNKRRTLDEAGRQKLDSFRQALQEQEIKVHFTIALGANNMVITVVNDSPILPDDAERIKKSREAHKRLFDEERSEEFFREDNLDTTESAGYGIGLADEILYEFGLNALEHFSIGSKEGKTTAVLKLPMTSVRH